MNEMRFFDVEARAAVQLAIEDIEAKTSAEVVVQVGRKADVYSDVDVWVGSTSAGMALLFLLFHPWEFPVPIMPLYVMLAFALGFMVSKRTDICHRRFVSRPRQEAAVLLKAKVTFLDRGISRTKDRTGVLVYVSVFEKAVVILSDLGLSNTSFMPIQSALQKSMQQEFNLEHFVRTLRELGPLLAAKYPRSADDINELPDTVVVV